jgi:guanylate kinase
MKGAFIVITGPSASGKTKLVERLLKNIPDSSRLITTTTRAPRPGEEDGVDYYFISREEFERRLKEDEFFEHAEVYGNLYGSSNIVLKETLEKSPYVFALIDIQGAQSLKEKMPQAFVIFLNPGSIDDIARRLKSERVNVNQEEIAKRIETATREIELRSHFDAEILNREGYFNDTVKQATALILSLKKSQ